MAKTPKTKIERMGLVKRVEELISAGTGTSAAISEALKAEGYSVSQPTVARYLKHVRETRQEETQQIIGDHVRKTVPADLDALETMEATCLAWATEEGDAFAHRQAAKHVADALRSEWPAKIASLRPECFLSADDYNKAIGSAVEDILRKCIGWIADDIELQKKRIAAMRQATSIIDLKLRYSGVIDGAAAGGIYLVGKGDELRDDPGGSGRLLLMKGSREAADA